MKRLGLIAALLALAAPSFAQVDAKVSKELQVGYAKMIGKLKSKDVKGMMTMVTKDAVIKEMGQTMTRDQFEANVKQQLGMMEFISASIKFQKLTVKNGVATTEHTETVKFKMPGGADGKLAVMDMVAKYKATFKNVGGDWKLHRSEGIGMPEMKMNGKAVNPMTMQPLDK